MPRRKRRVEPLERRDAGAPRTPGGQAHPVDSCGGLAHELDRGVLAIGRLRQRAGVTEHLAQSARVQGDDLGRGLDRLGHAPHVLDGNRADRAQRLGDDQIGFELVQLLDVQLVDGLAGQRALLDRGVDLRRAEAVGQDIARDPG